MQSHLVSPKLNIYHKATLTPLISRVKRNQFVFLTSYYIETYSMAKYVSYPISKRDSNISLRVEGQEADISRGLTGLRYRFWHVLLFYYVLEGTTLSFNVSSFIPLFQSRSGPSLLNIYCDVINNKMLMIHDVLVQTTDMHW